MKLIIVLDPDKAFTIKLKYPPILYNLILKVKSGCTLLIRPMISQRGLTAYLTAHYQTTMITLSLPVKHVKKTSSTK